MSLVHIMCCVTLILSSPVCSYSVFLNVEEKGLHMNETISILCMILLLSLLLSSNWCLPDSNLNEDFLSILLLECTSFEYDTIKYCVYSTLHRFKERRRVSYCYIHCNHSISKHSCLFSIEYKSNTPFLFNSIYVTSYVLIFRSSYFTPKTK